MKYGFFLGCNMPAIRPDVERAIRLTMPALGVELDDLDGYVCCPAFGTFPSLDEDAHLAVSAWNLSLGEEKGVDLMVECGSCYSSLRTGKYLLDHHPDRRERVQTLLRKAGKEYRGTAATRHVSDVLLNEVGTDKIRATLKTSLKGLRGVVQYPCHSLFPSRIVGFEPCSVQPRGLAELVEALGAEVEHFSLEYQCCGGAGGFHKADRSQAAEQARLKLEAIKSETRADFMVVSCITCLMYLDNVQHELGNGDGRYALPVFDYNQLLALCMGFPAAEVAAISTTSREPVLRHFAGAS